MNWLINAFCAPFRRWWPPPSLGALISLIATRWHAWRHAARASITRRINPGHPRWRKLAVKRLIGAFYTPFESLFWKRFWWVPPLLVMLVSLIGFVATVVDPGCYFSGHEDCEFALDHALGHYKGKWEGLQFFGTGFLVAATAFSWPFLRDQILYHHSRACCVIVPANVAQHAFSHSGVKGSVATHSVAWTFGLRCKIPAQARTMSNYVTRPSRLVAALKFCFVLGHVALLSGIAGSIYGENRELFEKLSIHTGIILVTSVSIVGWVLFFFIIYVICFICITIGKWVRRNFARCLRRENTP